MWVHIRGVYQVSISGVYNRCSGVYIRGVYIKGVHIRGVSCHLSMKGVFSVSTRSVVEEAHNVWHEVTDSQRVRHDIVDSDLNMDRVVRNCVKIWLVGHCSLLT